MLIIHGKGGHSRVVADAWRESHDYRPPESDCRFTDDKEGTRPCTTDYYIVAIGDNQARKLLGGTARVVHSTSVISGHVELGKGIYIGAHVVINPGAEIGDGAIINTGAIIEHDCKVGPWSHVAVGAVLCGGVEIGEGVLIGANAVLRPGVKVGDWATVGCGAAVVRDIPGGEMWAGVPARRISGVRGN